MAAWMGEINPIHAVSLYLGPFNYIKAYPFYALCSMLSRLLSAPETRNSGS